MGNSTSSNSKQMEEVKKMDEVKETKEIVEKIDSNNDFKSNEALKKIMPKEETNKKPKDEQDTSDILAGITEIEEKKAVMIPDEQKGGSKKKIPLLGGFKNNLNLSETSDNILYELKNKTGRKRYTKYDLFKILRDLDIDTDVENQKGGGDDSDNNTSLDDNKSMEHIKNIILNELETLKNNKSNQLGGNSCGCSGDKKNSYKSNIKFNMNNIIVDDDENKQLGGTVIIDASSSSTTTDDSESSSSEFGKQKVKKTKGKKYPKKIEYESESEDSKFFIETSESRQEHDRHYSDEKSSNGDTDEKMKENSETDKIKQESESEEGLSIFPFNSSDVKSSVSIKNYRMLRRKI